MPRLQPVFALFNQSLRHDLRALPVGVARTLLLVAALLALMPAQAASSWSYASAPGRTLFDSLAWITLVAITLAGIGFFPATIATDKEEKALGLLMMTDLSPLAILLGRSTARLATAMLFVLLTIPFLLLATTLGGVGLAQVAATSACLLAHLLLVANIGLLCSVVMSRAASAGALALALLLVLFLLPAIGLGIADSMQEAASWKAAGVRLEHALKDVLACTAFVRLNTILDSGFAGGFFCPQVVSNVAGAVLAFVLARLLFLPCCRTERDPATVRRLGRRRTGGERTIPPAVVGSAAITCKDEIFLYGGRRGFWIRIVMTVVLGGFICALVSDHTYRPKRTELAGCLMIVSLVLAALGTGFAGQRMLRAELNGRTLSSLMILPSTTRVLLLRKIAALLRANLLPILLVFVLGALIGPDVLGKALADLFDGSAMPLLMALCMLAMVVLWFFFSVFLSLFVRSAAAFLALVIIWFGTIPLSFLGMLVVAFSHSAELIPLLLLAFSLVLSIVLALAIPPILERKAAAE